MDHKIDHERGEMTLTLCGTKYQMRLDHEALARIKAEFEGETTIQVCGRLFGARHDERTLAIIIGHSCDKEYVESRENTLEDQILREGIVNVVEPVRDYMTLALNGFKEPPKEKKSGKSRRRNTRSDAS